MKSSFCIYRTITFLFFLIIFSEINAQQNKKDTTFVPEVGQAGKDVIWVPTPDDLLNKMLKIAEVKPTDIVVDLGSGDGRTVIAAAKLGARAVGIEFNPDMVKLSKQRAREAGVEEKTDFICADLFEYDLSHATVITMFLLPQLNLKLRPVLLGLKPGTRIVSNTFTMGDWSPDFEVESEENWNSWNKAMMWIVPVKIDGLWKYEGGELEIKQEYQFFFGGYRQGGKTSVITDGRINGDTVSFRIEDATFAGKVLPDGKILGTVTTASTKKDWIATAVK